MADNAMRARDYGPMRQLELEMQKRGIPMGMLGQLAGMGTSIGGLGNTTQGTKTSTTYEDPMRQYLAMALMGASMGAKAYASDIRVKEDITQVGKLNDGTPVYSFRYIGSPAFQIGLMAQDVEQYAPEAVTEIEGIKFVDYEIATRRARAT